MTDEGRITGSFLGHGSLAGSKPVYCPYKSRNIICRDDTQASGVLAPYTTHYGTGWERLRPSGPGAGWLELGHTNNDDGRLGYGGSHGGVGGYMYIWRTHNGQMRYRGGDPPIGETGGGKMGYGSYKTPRTQGSSGTPGHYYRRYGAAGGAAIEIEARNLLKLMGPLTQMASMVITIQLLISEQVRAGRRRKRPASHQRRTLRKRPHHCQRR